MSTVPIPASAHPGVEEAHAHISLLTRGQTTTLAGTGWFPDLSEFNGPPDWGALVAAYVAGTISAVAIRAGFGTVRADAQFATNQREARARGIPVVYYWFTYPAYNAAGAEAAMFNSVVGPLQPGEAMCGDFEDDPSAKPFPRGAAGLQWCRDFLTALQAPQNATWWYTYPFLLSSVGLQPLIGAWPFWEADYSATQDSAFAPAIARQFTDCGATPGVAGCCDQSRVLQAPLTQWLTPGEQDMTDVEAAMLKDVYAIVTSGAYEGAREYPWPPGSGQGDAWLTTQIKGLTAGQSAARAELDTLQAEVLLLQTAGVPAATLQPVLDSLSKLSAHLGVGTA